MAANNTKPLRTAEGSSLSLPPTDDVYRQQRHGFPHYLCELTLPVSCVSDQPVRTCGMKFHGRRLRGVGTELRRGVANHG